MRRQTFAVTLLAAAVLAGGGTRCDSNEGPTTTTTKTPEEGRVIVNNRTTLKNMPGGEGKDHVRIRICDSNGHCDTYPPSKVKDCFPGDFWPECRND